MKYDMVRIMTIAGSYRRAGYDKSNALKAAWYDVKNEMFRKAAVNLIQNYVSLTEKKDYRAAFNNLYTIYSNVSGHDVFKIVEEQKGKISKIDVITMYNDERCFYALAQEYIKLAG